MKMFNKIIELCERLGFLRRIKYPKLNLETFKVESTGALLQHNLQNEWFDSIVINKDVSVFPSLNGASETFDFAKEICLGTPPFAVTRFTQKASPSLQARLSNSKEIDFGNYFESGLVLDCCVFLSPVNCTQFFHQWQRERRMWWRKFSASPGRYVLTDIRTENNNVQSVQIVAKYSWGSQIVESLTLGGKFDGLSSSQLQIKNGKKMLQGQCLVNTICLSTMLLNTLCDAYEEPLFHGNPRPLLRLHRKLAPYKLSFSIPAGTKAIVEELKDLATYLCRQLRKNHVSCLFLPSSYKNTLEAQWKQYDQMGVPYNVLLNENTLKTGIVQLRNRDTTLKEQVHVTNLPQYVEQLFKNY